MLIHIYYLLYSCLGPGRQSGLQTTCADYEDPTTSRGPLCPCGALRTLKWPTYYLPTGQMGVPGMHPCNTLPPHGQREIKLICDPSAHMLDSACSGDPQSTAPFTIIPIEPRIRHCGWQYQCMQARLIGLLGIPRRASLTCLIFPSLPHLSACLHRQAREKEWSFSQVVTALHALMNITTCDSTIMTSSIVMHRYVMSRIE